jgi:hypothetical protein
LGPKTSAQSTYHKEDLTILHALRKWRHYVLGNRLIIKADQQSLRHMMTQTLTEGIQHKLLIKLMEFNYSIEYKKGKENKAANALPRREHHVSAISSVIPAWVTKIEASYTSDNAFTELNQQLPIDS